MPNVMHDLHEGADHPPREVTAADLANLPPKAASDGYLYVLAFGNGTVKVGSTINPSERIRTHQVSAAQFGVPLTEFWVSPEFCGYARAERRLIEAATNMSTHVAAREWFRGVDFTRLVEVARFLSGVSAAGWVADVLPSSDPWTRVKDALGVNTNAEAAARVGIPLSTVERMFIKPERSLMRNAFRIRAATGISLDELFPVEDTGQSLVKVAA